MTNNNITKKYLINGPNNVIRLINNDSSKILYIFGDYHLETNNQTECVINNEYESLDIDKFILLFMKKNKDKKYDIFAEIPDYLFNFYTLYKKDFFFKQKYIFNFDKIFNFKILNKYINFRFHFMDIRYNIIFFKLIKEGMVAFLSGSSYIGSVLLNYLSEITNLIKIFKINLNKNSYIKKILNKYSDSKIKKKIIFIFNLVLKKINFLIKNFNDLIKIIKTSNYKNEYINVSSPETNIDKICNININHFVEEFGKICVIITDLYFIRRFLDKKYINNSILYTGLTHMSDISYLLVKYFNFTITHIEYINNKKNINILIDKLPNNNFDYLDILDNLFTKKIDNNRIYQCTNLFNFPDNFT